MGIPHLITYLRPYATTVTLDGHSSSDSSIAPPSRQVIIDGPGLTYYVYYTYVAISGSLHHPLTTASLHEHIGQAIIAWLDQLRGCGIEIDRIYFDGALPSSKQDVRLSRLEAYRNRWSAYRSAHPNLDIVPYPENKELHQGFKPVTARGSPARPIRRGGLPAPAFLVPAALEAILANAHYTHITKVVPGEADTYCAGRARSVGGMILTADSDLLVYNVGQRGCVVYFADISFDGQHQGSQQESSDNLIGGLTCKCYWPAEILRRLSLEEPFGLGSLAFEVEQDSSVPFSSLLRRAKSRASQISSNSEFQDFLDRYRDSEEMPRFRGSNANPDSSVQALLTRLDPRVSELVWQTIDQTEQLKMYLPFLLDDPTRSSAWDVGASFRILGYSILGLTSPAPSVWKYIQEVGRRGQRIASSNITLLDSAAIRMSIGNLIYLFQSFKDTFPDISNRDRWTLFAIQEVIHTLVSKNTIAPNRFTFENLLLLQQTNNHLADWNAVHLLAQVQAASYSLRMLRQFSEVGLALLPTSTTISLGRLCQDLLAHLQTLPGLQAGYVAAEVESEEEILDWDRMMRLVYNRLGLKDEADMENQEEEAEKDVVIQTSAPLLSRKKRKTKRQKGAEKQGGGAGISIPQNIFAVLNTS